MTATRSTAATCSIGWTTSPVLLLCGSTPAYRSLSEGDSGRDVAELNANLVRPRVRDPSAARPVVRLLRLRDGVRAREAAVQAGRGSDRVAGARSGGVPARAGADRRRDRRARWIRPAGCPGPVRHIRRARGAAEPRSVAAGRGAEGRPRTDHPAGQQVGDREGGSLGERRPGACRARRQRRGRDHPGLRPSRRPARGTRARQGPGPGGDHDQGSGERPERPGDRARREGRRRVRGRGRARRRATRAWSP